MNKLPAISIPTVVGPVTVDNGTFKKKSLHTLELRITQRLREIEEEYKELKKKYEINKLVNESEFAFIPSYGQIYYLYERKESTGSSFLSLISPKEWGKMMKDFHFLGSFKLDSEGHWENG